MYSEWVVRQPKRSRVDQILILNRNYLIRQQINMMLNPPLSYSHAHILICSNRVLRVNIWSHWSLLYDWVFFITLDWISEKRPLREEQQQSHVIETKSFNSKTALKKIHQELVNTPKSSICHHHIHMCTIVVWTGPGFSPPQVSASNTYRRRSPSLPPLSQVSAEAAAGTSGSAGPSSRPG